MSMFRLRRPLNELSFNIVFAAIVLLFTAVESGADDDVGSGDEIQEILVNPDGSQDFTTIQAAIDAARSGATIFVAPGVYKERLVITNKSLRFLTGTPGGGNPGDERVIVDGSCNSSPTVVASSDFSLECVMFDGFVFRDGNGGAFEIFDIQLVLEDCELTNNIALFDGGAIFQVRGRLVMIRGVIEDNMTMQGGGATMSFDAEQEFINTIIRNNNAAGSGSAISNLTSAGKSTVCLTNSIVSGNSSGENGAVFAVGATVMINGGEISNNTAANVGGGVAAANCPNVAINNCVCSNNVCSGPGGGIFCQDCNVNVSNCVCGNNSSMNASGGGIYCIGGNFQCNNCNIVENFAGMNGGGCQLVDLLQGLNKIESCCFENNEASLNGGGLTNVQSEALVQLIKCKVLRNCAGANAGGVLVEDADLQAINTRIMANKAVDNGGGVLANVGANVTCNQCIIDGNTANVGGGLFIEQSALGVSNSNVVGNTAVQVAGAIAAAPAASVGILNSIIFSNGTIFPIFQSETDSVSAQYSIIEGGFAGMEIMDMEPHFIDEFGPDGIAGTGDENFCLAPNSSAIDAGLNESVIPDLTDLDWDSDFEEPTPLDYKLNNRFVSDQSTGDTFSFGAPIVDIGAIEFQGVVLLGDVNLDGAVNLLDIEPFVELLNSGGFQPEADTNQDGGVNLLDVESFVNLLSN